MIFLSILTPPLGRIVLEAERERPPRDDCLNEPERRFEQVLDTDTRGQSVPLVKLALEKRRRASQCTLNISLYRCLMCRRSTTSQRTLRTVRPIWVSCLSLPRTLSRVPCWLSAILAAVPKWSSMPPLSSAATSLSLNPRTSLR